MAAFQTMFESPPPPVPVGVVLSREKVASAEVSFSMHASLTAAGETILFLDCRRWWPFCVCALPGGSSLFVAKKHSW